MACELLAAHARDAVDLAGLSRLSLTDHQGGAVDRAILTVSLVVLGL